MVLEGLGGNDGGRKMDPGGVHARPSLMDGGSRRRWQPEVAKFTPGLFAGTFAKSKKGRRLSPRFFRCSASNPE
jgi:hypothetical protein